MEIIWICPSCEAENKVQVGEPESFDMDRWFGGPELTCTPCDGRSQRKDIDFYFSDGSEADGEDEHDIVEKLEELAATGELHNDN